MRFDESITNSHFDVKVQRTDRKVMRCLRLVPCSDRQRASLALRLGAHSQLPQVVLATDDGVRAAVGRGPGAHEVDLGVAPQGRAEAGHRRGVIGPPREGRRPRASGVRLTRRHSRSVAPVHRAAIPVRRHRALPPANLGDVPRLAPLLLLLGLKPGQLPVVRLEGSLESLVRVLQAHKVSDLGPPQFTPHPVARIGEVALPVDEVAPAERVLRRLPLPLGRLDRSDDVVHCHPLLPPDAQL
mmetsp:Transcript_54012/g.161672  ORF Transcript_54012/g.161672 Transcript_54012/m.161672 type:complete len:242 (-) Transcript_54012:3278-4003(-)